ncbi:hypothetical protein KUD11_04045 [Roseovarius sp. LXJ103]|uniref:LPS export ABC transporter periplasmic protein LptC n=1 Tax=Roseovarius carneus TaxID=2853164 RepID=UPI000D60912D|nr:hypothetical protein [Roseovarius carneus]MBZ8117810.1 hypothetical protein [Roseovarius carneus]PWE36425.1 hypothetical protein DD563_10915 [Pelagicola sp. LXJ1103]
MVLGENFHSRFVAWAKIILPILALGLLSTLFLLSRTVDVSGTIPYSTIDLEQRAQDQGATNPRFAGVATGGEEVSFIADTVRPDPTNPEKMLADQVRAQVNLLGGTVMNIEAANGESDQLALTAQLTGDVRVLLTTGYDIRTERLDAQFDTVYAESPGPVTATGPPGDLQAGRMVLTTGGEVGDADLLFTDGVKLIYLPRETKD